jgi:hypothetical protein
MKTRYKYAVRFPFGPRTIDQSGRLIRTVHRFATRTDRDQWVANGPDYGQPGTRETVTYSAIAAEIKRAIGVWTEVHPDDAGGPSEKLI